MPCARASARRLLELGSLAEQQQPQAIVFRQRLRKRAQRHVGAAQRIERARENEDNVIVGNAVFLPERARQSRTERGQVDSRGDDMKGMRTEHPPAEHIVQCKARVERTTLPGAHAVLEVPHGFHALRDRAGLILDDPGRLGAANQRQYARANRAVDVHDVEAPGAHEPPGFVEKAELPEPPDGRGPVDRQRLR
jgi:hypothetical protein